MKGRVLRPPRTFEEMVLPQPNAAFTYVPMVAMGGADEDCLL